MPGFRGFGIWYWFDSSTRRRLSHSFRAIKTCSLAVVVNPRQHAISMVSEERHGINVLRLVGAGETWHEQAA